MKKTISITSNIINKIARWGKVINDVTIAIVTIALATIGYFALCKKFFGIDMIAAIKAAFTPEAEEDDQEDVDEDDGENESEELKGWDAL